MADKTFSIDNDLYLTSQSMEHDPTVNRINRQIEELSRTPDLSPELSNQLRSYTIIASQIDAQHNIDPKPNTCLLYTSPSPRDRQKSRMPSSA